MATIAELEKMENFDCYLRHEFRLRLQNPLHPFKMEKCTNILCELSDWKYFSIKELGYICPECNQ